MGDKNKKHMYSHHLPHKHRQKKKMMRLYNPRPKNESTTFDCRDLGEIKNYKNEVLEKYEELKERVFKTRENFIVTNREAYTTRRSSVPQKKNDKKDSFIESMSKKPVTDRTEVPKRESGGEFNFFALLTQASENEKSHTRKTSQESRPSQEEQQRNKFERLEQLEKAKKKEQEERNRIGRYKNLYPNQKAKYNVSSTELKEELK